MIIITLIITMIIIITIIIIIIIIIIITKGVSTSSLYQVAPWCSGYHYCKTSLKSTVMQI